MASELDDYLQLARSFPTRWLQITGRPDDLDVPYDKNILSY